MNCDTVKIAPEALAKILAGILDRGKVKVAGLGIFEVRTIPSRAGRNPKTGGIMTMPEYRKVKFRPTSSLKREL